VNYHHRFIVAASLERVAKFHRSAASMAAITPPPIVVKINETPAVLASGDRMSFTMWLGPLPVRWKALIEDAHAGGFRDRQLHGPFATWVHTHRFIAVDETTTEVVDEVNASLSKHLLWGPLGLAMWLGMPLLFAYRGWKTRQLLA
jgi:ligand-binding SRPBCC domain-containing protein